MQEGGVRCGRRLLCLWQEGLLEPFFNLCKNLLGFREAVHGLLGKHKLTVNGDLENASTGGDQINLLLKSFRQAGGQTGRSGFVVSNRAILDRDEHVVLRTQVRTG